MSAFSGVKPGFVVACLISFVIASSVARWHRSHSSGRLRGKPHVPLNPRVPQDRRQTLTAANLIQKRDAVPRTQKIHCALEREDVANRDKTNPACDGLDAIGREVEANRVDLRSQIVYLLNMSRNFQKDRVTALRHKCEDAESRFWQALRLGEPAAGVYQFHWGEALLELREAETAMRRGSQEAEATERLGTPSANQYSWLGKAISEDELYHRR